MSVLKRDTLLGTTAVVALLSASLPALAQDPPAQESTQAAPATSTPDPTSQQSGDGGPAPVLEEVVVTGARNHTAPMSSRPAASAARTRSMCR